MKFSAWRIPHNRSELRSSLSRLKTEQPHAIGSLFIFDTEAASSGLLAATGLVAWEPRLGNETAVAPGGLAGCAHGHCVARALTKRALSVALAAGDAGCASLGGIDEGIAYDAVRAIRVVRASACPAVAGTRCAGGCANVEPVTARSALTVVRASAGGAAAVAGSASVVVIPAADSGRVIASGARSAGFACRRGRIQKVARSTGAAGRERGATARAAVGKACSELSVGSIDEVAATGHGALRKACARAGVTVGETVATGGIRSRRAGSRLVLAVSTNRAGCADSVGSGRASS